MTQLNGINLKNYGLVLVAYDNLLNMPSRIGVPFHDWGDELQPLVQAEDLVWGSNVIKLKAFFDARLGVDLEKTIIDLRGLKEVSLTTDYGVFETTLLSVSDVVIIDGHAILVISFEQKATTFTDTPAISPTGGAGFTLDGYNLLKDFGILVRETKALNDVPEYISSRETVFKEPRKRTDLRTWGQVKISCSMERSDAVNLHKLRYILSTPELKKITYRGFSYDCFLSRGFTPKFGKSSIDFVLELNVGLRDSTISVYGNGIKIVNNDLTPSLADGTNFGEVDIIGQTLDKTYTIQNDGSVNLGVYSVEVVGEGFTLQQAPFSNIGAGNSSTFKIRYNPNLLKNHSAIIKINNSDLLYTPYIFKVSGTAKDSSLVGVLGVTGDGNLIADGDITPISADFTDFGQVETSRTKTNGFLLKNNGTLPLIITGVSVSPSNDFSVSSNYTAKLNPGGSTALIVTFLPTSQTVQNSELAISWTNGRDVGTNVFNFQIKGEGTPYNNGLNIEFKYNGLNILNGSGANTTNGTRYPDAQENDGSIIRTFTVHNVGTENITKAYFTGSSAFSISKQVVFPLTGGNVNNLDVRFAPLSAGNKVATLHIETATKTFQTGFDGQGLSAPDTTQVKLTGNGQEIALNGNIIKIADGTDFGVRNTNTTPDIIHVFTVKNIGTTDLVITPTTLQIVYGEGFFLFSNLLSGTLYAGQSQNFSIRFVGSNIHGASYTARVAFFSNNTQGNASTQFNFLVRGDISTL